ncbi:MAG: NAD(P)H-hydrate dehydratase [Oscillospiraceae bacterium]
MKLCTSAEARGMDEYTINTLGVPSITLMERASSHLAREAVHLLGENTNAAVFIGHGNNGGDGIGAAICLLDAGKSVRVFLVGNREKMTPDTMEMERRLNLLGADIEELPDTDDDLSQYLGTCSVIIDAIYGFGFHLPLKGEAIRACRLINSSDAMVVAADIPSGVETDTGFAASDAVMADVTVTFSRAKVGQFITPGALYCGEVLVRDIGVSEPEGSQKLTGTFAVEDEDVVLPVRRRDAHKGDFGKCLIIAGSTGYTGAASFASRAAVRMGAGLVFLGVPEHIYQIEAVKNDEAIVFPLPCDRRGRLSAGAADDILERLSKCSVCLIGPGLGISSDVDKIINAVIACSAVPLVIDADGITSVSGNIDILSKAKCPLILTPHDGEFARLGGDLISRDRLTAARSFASAHNVILVLKGCRTITAFPDGSAYVNTSGNPGMAKGGSGDVLAGMIASLIGQGLGLKEAVTGAVYLHGRAGDVCSAAFGEYAMTPSDMIGAIKDVTR